MMAQIRCDVDLAIVGAGPCGLAAAIAARRPGLSAVVFDRGPIVNGITNYPTYMTFFSTAERIAIGGVPFIVPTEKPSERDALAYYRGVASLLRARRAAVRDGRGSAGVRSASRAAARGWLHARGPRSARATARARAVVVATGYFGPPEPPRRARRVAAARRSMATSTGTTRWNQQVVVVGGGNSAVDAALDMYRAGAA